MGEKKCKKCEFKEIIDGKIYCKLAHDFVINLGRFCPKELSPEELQASCKFYMPPEDTINKVVGICRVPLREAGYSDPCRLTKPEQLLFDPDFEAKEEVR